MEPKTKTANVVHALIVAHAANVAQELPLHAANVANAVHALIAAHVANAALVLPPHAANVVIADHAPHLAIAAKKKCPHKLTTKT